MRVRNPAQFLAIVVSPFLLLFSGACTSQYVIKSDAQGTLQDADHPTDKRPFSAAAGSEFTPDGGDKSMLLFTYVNPLSEAVLQRTAEATGVNLQCGAALQLDAKGAPVLDANGIAQLNTKNVDITRCVTEAPKDGGGVHYKFADANSQSAAHPVKITGWEVGGLAIPFKLRTRDGIFDTNSTVAFYVAPAWIHRWVSGLTLPIIAGPSSIALGATNTTNKSTQGATVGLGLIGAPDNSNPDFQVGLVAGADFTGVRSYRYEGDVWVTLAIGYKFLR